MIARTSAAVLAALMLMAFAPQQTPARTPDCDGPAPQKAKKEFVEGYQLASVYLKTGQLPEAIALANSLETSAVNDLQRSKLSSIRQTAYAGLKDDRGVLTEAERQIDLGCLAPDQLSIQTDMAAFVRKQLGLPPR